MGRRLWQTTDNFGLRAGQELFSRVVPHADDQLPSIERDQSGVNRSHRILVWT
jgi:hypothetical protein